MIVAYFTLDNNSQFARITKYHNFAILCEYNGRYYSTQLISLTFDIFLHNNSTDIFLFYSLKSNILHIFFDDYVEIKYMVGFTKNSSQIMEEVQMKTRLVLYGTKRRNMLLKLYVRHYKF